MFTLEPQELPLKTCLYHEEEFCKNYFSLVYGVLEPEKSEVSQSSAHPVLQMKHLRLREMTLASDLPKVTQMLHVINQPSISHHARQEEV